MTNAPVSPVGRRHVPTRGDRLRAARQVGRLSQAEFAALCGISRNSVSRYETDVPGADKPIVIMRWAEVTGFDYDWLQNGDGISPNTATDRATDSLRYPERYAAA